jgi:hypothetical protein
VVSTCETVGDEATVVETVSPYELTYETDETGVDGTDGELTKAEAGIEVMVCPDSTMDGVLDDGAGV